jgi:hypothetical protein
MNSNGVRDMDQILKADRAKAITGNAKTPMAFTFRADSILRNWKDEHGAKTVGNETSEPGSNPTPQNHQNKIEWKAGLCQGKYFWTREKPDSAISIARTRLRE